MASVSFNDKNKTNKNKLTNNPKNQNTTKKKTPHHLKTIEDVLYLYDMKYFHV